MKHIELTLAKQRLSSRHITQMDSKALRLRPVFSVAGRISSQHNSNLP